MSNWRGDSGLEQQELAAGGGGGGDWLSRLWSALGGSSHTAPAAQPGPPRQIHPDQPEPQFDLAAAPAPQETIRQAELAAPQAPRPQPQQAMPRVMAPPPGTPMRRPEMAQQQPQQQAAPSPFAPMPPMEAPAQGVWGQQPAPPPPAPIGLGGDMRAQFQAAHGFAAPTNAEIADRDLSRRHEQDMLALPGAKRIPYEEPVQLGQLSPEVMARLGLVRN